MIALVVCSGCSWNPSESSTPMRSGLREVDHHHLLLEIGAGRIAEGVPGSPVALLGDERVHVGAVLISQPQLLADACVPVLRQGLRSGCTDSPWSSR